MLLDVEIKKKRGYVYFGSEVIATLTIGNYGTSPVVTWLHRNPITESQRATLSNGASVESIAIEADPFGLNAGLEVPEGPPADNGESSLVFPRYGDILNGSTGCTLDNQMVSCDTTAKVEEAEAGGRLPEGVRAGANFVIDPKDGTVKIGMTGYDGNSDQFGFYVHGGAHNDDDIENELADYITRFVPFQGGKPNSQSPAQAPFDWPLFWDLVNAAGALQRESCRNLFGSNVDPTRLLGQLAAGDARLGSISRGDLGAASGDTATSAQTTGILGSRTVTRPDGTTFKQSTFTGANIILNNNAASPYQSGCGGRFGAGDGINRAITLIHELGHAAGLIYGARASRIVDDQNNTTQSKANSQLVYDSCFRGL